MESKVSLNNLGSGAAIELFEAELARLVENVLDPNTDAQKMRKITLVLKVKPDKHRRGVCEYSLECTSQLAAQQPYESTLYVGFEGMNPVVTEVNQAQGRLFDTGSGSLGVTTPHKEEA